MNLQLTDDLAGTAGESARSGFFLASGSAIGTIIMSIGAILCGRLLGPELYGQYTLVLVGPQLLFLFTDMGINQGIIKLTADLRSKGELDRIPQIIRCGLILRIITGIIMSVILFVFAETFASAILNRPDLYFYLRIMSIVILFQAIYTTAYSSFVSIDKAEYSALTLNVEAIIKTSLSITLVLLGFNLVGALVGNVVGYVVAGIFGVLMLRTVLSRKHGITSNARFGLNFKDDMTTLIRYGLPIYGAFLLVGFTPLYQNLVLANLTTDAAVGNFKAASNFAAIMAVLSVPITTALLSGFSKIDSTGRQRVRIFFKTANKFTSLVVFPVTFLFVIFANEIVQIVYGSTYESASLFLALNSLLYLLVGFGYLNLGSFYNGVGETKMTLKIGIATFILVAALSPLLAQNYGVPGLIVALLFANAVGTSYGAYVAKKKYSVEFDARAVSRIFIISMLSAVPSYLLRFAGLTNYHALLFGGIVYVAVYMTLIPLTRIVARTELEMLENVIHKIGPLGKVGSLALKFQKELLSVSLSIKREREG